MTFIDNAQDCCETIKPCDLCKGKLIVCPGCTRGKIDDELFMGCGVHIRCPSCFGFDIALEDKKFMEEHYENLTSEIVLRYEDGIHLYIKEKNNECLQKIKELTDSAKGCSVLEKCLITNELFTFVVENKWYILQPKLHKTPTTISKKLKEFYKNPKFLHQWTLQSWHLQLFGSDIRCGCQLKFESPENTL
jgi:hypothetical protein